MNTKRWALTAVLSAMTFAAGMAHAQTGLNAPVNNKPTVRSEIKRGNSAGFDCFLKTTTNYLGFTSCISAVQDLNEQQSTLSDPFVLGLSVEALANAEIIKPGEGGGWISTWQKDTVRIMKAYKLTAKDICAAVGSQGCENVTRIINKAQSQK